ncbi:aminotransferase class V-fold PLP-dependent enzyme [Lutibaculum baratangense]|uniref:Serine--glyoxylate aminotransferase n=1 Tax=Lutibaculum baratangense AMV1 TaxID=631454 RepID=V4RBT0_9HYPH|nr:aminotransferase class V-fold PLP-dependent enzyme [Lutibaculum baratangense]ESR22854.1 Serine--glyoxylate aminotransferase [Lutibaculum baratangense AMV1]
MRAGYHALFIPGPTNLPERLRTAMFVPSEDQRSPDFPKLTVPLFNDIKRIFKMSSGHVFLYPGSGTGGWEAALTNTLSPGDKVLTSVFGQFSHLWADMCRRHGLNLDAIEVPWGEGVPVETYAERLAADKNHEIKAVLVCHNETATGVTSDVAAVRKALDAAGHPAMLMVDGVSSIASIDFRMDEWGVDICVSGTQKGFMLPTGLSIVAASDRAIGETTRAKLPRTYFSFEDMLKLNKDGYFPYTPATPLLHGLRASIDLLEEEGLENVFARHHRIAEGVRKAVDAWGLKLCAREPKWHSDTVSAILVPEGFDAGKVVSHAYHRYGLSLGAGLSKVAGKVFRIGHLGWMNELMIMQALAGVEMTMRDLGMQVEAGVGVAAAEEHYRRSAAGASSTRAAA